MTTYSLDSSAFHVGQTAPRPEVLAALGAGKRSFEAEATRHLRALYSFALKLSRSPHDAEDLVSDTFLRSLDRWEQFKPGSNMRAWLFTILYHLFVSRKRRIDAREVPQSDNVHGAHELVGDADPESTFFDSFIDDEIVQAIDRLPKEYRSVVLLSDVNGLRYAEIAERLSIPEGTVKSRLFRGRRILQGELRGYATEMGYLRETASAA